MQGMEKPQDNPFETPVDVRDEPAEVAMTSRQVWMLVGVVSIVVAIGYTSLDAVRSLGVLDLEWVVIWGLPAVGLLVIAFAATPSRNRATAVNLLVGIPLVASAGYICFVPVCTGLTLMSLPFSGPESTTFGQTVGFGACVLFSMFVSGALTGFVCRFRKNDKKNERGGCTRV